MNKKKKAYSKKLIWEKYYPYFLTIFLFIAYLLNEHYCWITIEKRTLIELSINLFGILLGFFITVLTVINSLDNIYIRKLRSSGTYAHLLNYLKNAIKTNVLMLIYALIYLSVYFDNNIQWMFDHLGILIFLFTLFSAYRFIDVFLYITNTPND